MRLELEFSTKMYFFSNLFPVIAVFALTNAAKYVGNHPTPAKFHANFGLQFSFNKPQHRVPHSFPVVNGPTPNTTVHGCPAERDEPWTYDRSAQNGPKFWGKTYPDCNGSKQSPINIITADAVKDVTSHKLTYRNYDKPITQGTILNNGHTLQVTPTDGVSRTINIRGSPYELKQFHFHWGEAKKNGSEHTVNGIQYAMEMHLVHLNKTGQIGVVAFLFKETAQGGNSKEIKKLFDQFPEVKYKGDSTALKSSFDLSKSFKIKAFFYRYLGSLTTPGCAEGVTWSVAKDPLSIGTDELNKLRQLYAVKKKDNKGDCRLVNNYRPVQPLNGRFVRLAH